MSDQEINFKVTDRRLFNPDGSPRELSSDEKAEAQPAAKSAEPESQRPTESYAATSAEPARESTPAPSEDSSTETEDDLDAEDPASFANFMMSIASNAASSLGMMEHPVTHKREVDLELGKHWIDVLGMLEKKTRGNLSPQEKQILESLLSDLRMQYVSLTHSSSVKTAKPFTGRDIVGG